MAKIRLGIVGVNHGHIYGMIRGLLETGDAEVTAGYAAEPELRAQADEILGPVPWRDPADAVIGADDVDLVCTAAINGDRGGIILDCLAAGRSVFVDKPMLTRLDELEAIERAVEGSSANVFVFYSERLGKTIDRDLKERIDGGEIGDLVYIAGFGPHKLSLPSRPSWMFDPDRYGGILCDIASHQFELFEWYTGERIVPGPARVANYHLPRHPRFHDFGDAMFTGDRGTAGYIRADWLTPDAMPVFGDVRQLLVGTDGQIEIRRYTDLSRADQDTAVFLTTRGEPPRRLELPAGPNPFFAELIADVRNGVNRCMPHDRAFDAARAAIVHQRDAVRIGR